MLLAHANVDKTHPWPYATDVISLLSVRVFEEPAVLRPISNPGFSSEGLVVWDDRRADWLSRDLHQSAGGSIRRDRGRIG